MFLKRLTRRKNGKNHTYWALVETIRTELGSLAPVLMGRMERLLRDGIGGDTADDLEAVGEEEQAAKTSRRELESQRDDLPKLRGEIEEAGEVLNRSREALEFDPVLLDSHHSAVNSA